MNTRHIYQNYLDTNDNIHCYVKVVIAYAFVKQTLALFSPSYGFIHAIVKFTNCNE